MIWWITQILFLWYFIESSQHFQCLAAILCIIRAFLRVLEVLYWWHLPMTLPDGSMCTILFYESLFWKNLDYGHWHYLLVNIADIYWISKFHTQDDSEKKSWMYQPIYQKCNNWEAFKWYLKLWRQLIWQGAVLEWIFLVHVMSWRWANDKILYDMQWRSVFRIKASPGLNDLTKRLNIWLISNVAIALKYRNLLYL